MIIRIQSPNGTRRVEVTAGDTTKALYEKVHDAFNLPGYEFSLYRTRDKKNEIVSSGRKTIKGCKMAHGEMIFLCEIENNNPRNDLDAIATPSTSSNTNSSSLPDDSAMISSSNSKSSIIEDLVDQILSTTDGRVQRKRNPALCRHAGNSKCIHCSPLDPWDDSILQENKIKHLSFHGYLRKMTSGVDKGKFSYLEDISCKIKPGCKEHPPWPQGICSKCQPSAITLKRQEFRHVDNVTFENPSLVERFINYWRVTGHQRVGFLYGQYHPHLDVPLGIKASIAAIYEPPQEGSRDHVNLLPDPKKNIVDEIARGMNLTCVGWIFTDLVPLDPVSGTVKFLRHVESFFLSAHEVITSGHFQNLYPNTCKLSPSGFFGSKFVTVIVTGDKDNQVHMEGYQVSNQCQALVRDNCLIPTKDAPEFAYVKESSAKQYVPDVYFKEKDQYGNEVVRLGRPLPVEYLLLDCPVSTPNEPIYTFTNVANQFPVENRLVEGHLQDFSSVVSHFGIFTDDQFLKAISDFHLLIYLATMDTLPLKDYLKPLLNAVAEKDSAAAHEWKSTSQWATVEQLIAASSGTMSSSSNDFPNISNSSQASAMGNGSSSTFSRSSATPSWTCGHCTFINQSQNENCDMCHLPR